MLAKMLEKGMFIRMPGVAPQSRCIRVSVGHDWELDMVDEVLGSGFRGIEIKMGRKPPHHLSLEIH